MHHANWTQFRNNAANNAVVSAALSVSWRLPTDGSFSASPTLAGGRLFIGDNAGTLYAVNPLTGTVEWTFHAKSPLMSNPLVVNGMVIVSEGNQISYKLEGGREQVGTSQNAVIALDAATGKQRWHVSLYGTGMPTPAILGDTLVEHDGNGYVTGIKTSNGHILYRRFIAGTGSMDAVLPVGNDQFITAGSKPNSVWKMNAKTGRVLWERPFGVRVSGLSDCPLAAAGGRVFCDYTVPPPGKSRLHVGAAAGERVFALDSATGTRDWDVPLASGTLPEWNEAAIPMVYRGILYAGSSVAPQMHALDPATGRMLWTLRVHGAVKSGACGKDGVIYFGDFAGYLWAVRARDGSVIGVKNMHTVFNVGSPIIAGDTLIVGTKTKELLAIPLERIRSSHDG